MKNIKKWILGLFCLLIFAVGLSADVKAEGDFQIEDGVLIGYFGPNSAIDITIPDGVSSIGRNAFDGYTELKSITIPGSVTRIEMNAFRDCKSLTQISIPGNVRYIGANAFCGCKGLTSITIPDSVTTMMDRAFDGCTGLTTAKLSASMDVVRWGTFRDCKNLENVVIPVSVTAIKGYCFWNCSKLTDIYYGGTSSDWNKIELKNSDGSEKALAGVNPTIHYSTQTVVIKVKKVTLNTKKINGLWVGNTAQLIPTITPSNASNQAVTWTSSKPGIAYVDDTGLVHAVSKGTTNITCKTIDGKKTAKCTVKVEGPIALKTVKLAKKKATVDLRNAKKAVTTMKVNFNPAKATNKNIWFDLSNPAVASLSYDAAKAKLTVTGQSVGYTEITVHAEDGGSTYKCALTVKDTGLVTGISYKKKANVKAGKTVKIKATVKPSTARNKTVHYSSSNPAIATVDENGVVTGITPGVVTITAVTDESAFPATCEVTVK